MRGGLEGAGRGMNFPATLFVTDFVLRCHILSSLMVPFYGLVCGRFVFINQMLGFSKYDGLSLQKSMFVPDH